MASAMRNATACFQLALWGSFGERTGAGAHDISRNDESPTSSRYLIARAREAKRDSGTALDRSSIRARIAQFHVEDQGIKNFYARMQQQMANGEPPPLSLPITKLTGATRGQQIHAFAMDLEEAGGIIQQPSDTRDDKFYDYLYAASLRIAAGADQVLRNQIADRALGRPGEIRIDKNVAFDKLPS